MPLSFQNDIAPIFAPFQPAMMWRFDLLNYQQVVANIDIIINRISIVESPTNNIPMPPPPFPPLTQEQINAVKQWKAEGFPP